jgi:hypothetical protein
MMHGQQIITLLLFFHFQSVNPETNMCIYVSVLIYLLFTFYLLHIVLEKLGL